MVDHKKKLNLERIFLIGSIVFFVIAFGYAGWAFYYNNYVYEAPVNLNITLEEYFKLENNKNNNSVWVEVNINLTPLNLPLPFPLPY